MTITDPSSSDLAGVIDRYRRRADAFEHRIANVTPDRWTNQSPCGDWNARDVVQHCLDMHAAMLIPLSRSLSVTSGVTDDPIAAFRSARADIEAILSDPNLAAVRCDTPIGSMTVATHIDSVASEDLIIHGWDLARATGQDDTIDPAEAEHLWKGLNALPADRLDQYRTPGAFGPDIIVYGPEVPIPTDAPLQHRLLGALGRDPSWRHGP